MLSDNGSIKQFVENTEDISARDSITVNNNELIALFDTGCKPWSIMNSTTAELLQMNVIPIKKCLSTAKKGARVEIIGYTDARVEYKSVKANIRMYIVEDISDVCIISLHDILRYFLKEFYELLVAQQQVIMNECNNVEYIYPWSEKLEEAPELLEMYNETENDQFCDYLNLSYSDARKQYLEKIKENTEPDMWSNSNIRQLLESELAMSVFVNPTWTGIEIEPF